MQNKVDKSVYLFLVFDLRAQDHRILSKPHLTYHIALILEPPLLLVDALHSPIDVGLLQVRISLVAFQVQINCFFYLLQRSAILF